MSIDKQTRLRIQMGAILDQRGARERDHLQLTCEIKDRFQVEYESRKIPVPDPWSIRQMIAGLGVETVVEKGYDLLCRSITLEAAWKAEDFAPRERCARQILPRPGPTFHSLAWYESDQGALIGILTEAFRSRGFSLKAKLEDHDGHQFLDLHIGVESEIDLVAVDAIRSDLEAHYYDTLSD